MSRPRQPAWKPKKVPQAMADLLAGFELVHDRLVAQRQPGLPPSDSDLAAQRRAYLDARLVEREIDALVNPPINPRRDAA